MVATMLMLSATAANAQQNIQKAFEALLNENRSEIKTQHSLEKDPETGIKEGEMDIYDFILPSPTSKQKQLIKDIEKAFEKDKEEAYSLNSGNCGNHASLVVGKGRSASVGLGNIKGSRYIYACFLDKNDPEKTKRYAYAMEWAEKEKEITVRLAKTYATMPQYSEGRNSSRKIIINGQEIDLSEKINEAFGYNGSEAWLNKFNNLRTLFLKKSEGPAANSWATEIYKLCKNADSLDEAERVMVAQEIAKLKTSTNDEFIKNLFDMCIKRLGK